MDFVIKFAQITTGNYVDQAGRQRMILYALDSIGALWCDEGDGDGWRRVEQPPNSSGNPFANTTRGLAG